MDKIYKCKLGEMDCSKYPIMIFRFAGIEPTVEDIKGYEEVRIKAMDATQGPHVYITDGTNLKWFNGSARVEFGRVAKRIEEKYEGRCKKLFVVVPNIMINMVLRGINLVLKSRVPQVICKSFNEAYKLAEEEIKLIYSEEVV